MSGASSVVVLDYGSGNLRSVCRALARTGADVALTSDPTRALAADGLVVPGVGAYAACMAGLERVGGVDVIRSRVAAQRPLLGICVGFQVLFERGIEHGAEAEGCGILSGTVERLAARRLPHMGWNVVEPPDESVLFDGVGGERFYFVHSYGVRSPQGDQAHGVRSPQGDQAYGVRSPRGDQAGVAWCRHESDQFVAAIETAFVAGTQFHPEKSGSAGARLLRNWTASLHG